MNTRTSVGAIASSNMLARLLNGNGEPRLEYLLKANATAGTDLFFFALEDVDTNTRRIKGVCKRADGDWIRQSFPYPDVLYKRYPVSPRETRLYEMFIRQLRAQGAMFLNYQFQLDKWKTFQCVSRNPSLQQYLPPTWLMKERSRIFEVLAAYPAVYIKACTSGRGRQVMRVENLGHGQFSFSRYVSHLTRGVCDKNSLLQEINHFFDNRPIIAQAAVNLIQVDGRNVDFRAEMQRNGSSSPRVIGICARIAGKNSPITTHAESMPLQRFCAQQPSLIPDYAQIVNKAVPMLLDVYQQLEQCWGRCGELGIDFALDRKGKLWLFEANSQSTKVSLFNSFPEPYVVESYVGLLEYAKAEAQGKKRKTPD